MKVIKKIKKAAKQSKVFRYRTYKKIGCVGHRKTVDKIFFFSMICCLVIGAVLLIRPVDESTPDIYPAEAEQPFVNTDAQEVVHSDLGDEPVIEEEGVSLVDLENKVKAQQAKLKTYTLNKGETLSKFLNRSNIAKEKHAEIIDTLSVLIDVKTLKSGTIILVFTDKKDVFQGLAIPSTGDEVIAVLQEEDGSMTPFSQEGRVETVIERVKGRVERTFNGSAQKAGIPQVIISQITNALAGEVDFRGNMRKGDTFDIIYEKKVTPSGLELDINKQLLFVGLQMGKKSIYRYLYTDRSGTPAFYNPQGQRGQQSLAKRPVKAIPRLSSPYGWRRHPVLMYRIFHKGVDLACSKGTPVYAAADGTVTHIGRKGAYGKYIRIKHAGGYETAYAHLNGYRKGLKNGSRVKSGEIIGYVGATGRVTGPHLHFEVWKNGKTTNPFDNHQIGGKQLQGFELEQFQSFAESIHLDFQKQLFGKHPPIPPKKPF